MAIKRFHEAPLSIFDKVSDKTDGDYFLVHLFETNPEYLDKAIESVERGREVILDNSLFELREAFDGDRFAYWVEKVKPTYYIVPDSWHNTVETMRMFDTFVKKYPNLPSKRIGVAQGETLESVIACYKHIEPRCDKIAFNFDFSMFGHFPDYMTDRERMSSGRMQMIKALYTRGVINTDKPHHLLGVGVPQEVMWYPKTWWWIDSVDTCNPVIEGMYGENYSDNIDCPGLKTKTLTKVCDIIESAVSEEQWNRVARNIEIFRKMS